MAKQGFLSLPLKILRVVSYCHGLSTRKSLAEIFLRLRAANYSFTGAADHVVSEALYLDDPDGNGETLLDRTQRRMVKNAEGKLICTPVH